MIDLNTNLLESIQPQEVIGYLQLHGWKEQRKIGDKASIWTHPDEIGDEFEVLVPLRRELRDYLISLSNLVEILEVAEQRDQSQILNDLTSYSADILRVRVNTPKTTSGRIPFNDGIKFSNSVKNLIISAARAAIKPQAYFENQIPQQIDNYLNDLQMGHEKGSYILDVISPITNANQIALNLPEENGISSEPFGRRTMKQLIKSLIIVQNIAERVHSREISLDHFLGAISEGVSANLCNAIVGIDESGENRGVEIHLSWSPILELSKDIPRSIFIPHRIISTIKNAAEKLQSLHIENFELRGTVIELHRLPEARTGKVIVRGIINDKVADVALQLEDQEYKIAVQAHEEIIQISVFGDLSKESKTFKLLNSNNFSLAS
jgi:hypothetical protein